MKVKAISYERVVNLGNYESERIGVQIEQSEGENLTAQELFNQAVQFVEDQLPPAKKKRTPVTPVEDAPFF